MRLPNRPVAVLLVAGVVAAAGVVSSVTTASSTPLSAYASGVVSYGALPHNGWSTASSCPTDPPHTAPTFDFVEGPDAPPSGYGSLRVATTGGGGVARVELPVYGMSALTLSTITAKYDVLAADDPFPGSGYASLLVTVQDPAHPDAWTYVSVKGGAVGAGWQPLDLLTSGITVDVLDKTTGAPVVDRTTSTWGQYRAFTTGATVVGATLATACFVPTTVAWDDVTITAAGVSTTYDLEPSVATTLSTAAAAPATVVSGSATTVSGSLLRSSDSSGVVGTAVELWAKPTGVADFAKVTTVTSGVGGAVSASVRPTTTTSYRWQLPSTSTYTATASAAVTVATKPALTLNRVASSVTYPAPVVLFGAMRPGVAGAVVTLKRSGTSTAVATTTVKADGTFAFSRKLPRGSYTFWVTVPSSAGQTAATSAKVSVKVV